MADVDPELSPPRRRPDDLPEGIDPVGVPRERTGHETFIVLLALVIAMLVLTFTVGWIVFHRLQTG